MFTYAVIRAFMLEGVTVAMDYHASLQGSSLLRVEIGRGSVKPAPFDFRVPVRRAQLEKLREPLGKITATERQVEEVLNQIAAHLQEMSSTRVQIDQTPNFWVS